MSDNLLSGRKFLTLNLIEDYNREALHIEIDYSRKSSRVVWVLNHLVSRRGKPQRIRMDNGPELIATLMEEWSQAQGLAFTYIEPGKPKQNAFVERFNVSVRGSPHFLIFKRG
jgi:putative transposase